jgi:hypothetical protein
MGKSMADTLIERGKKEGAINALQETLVQLLQQQFGDLPPEVVERIQATGTVKRLQGWMRRLMSAESLDEVKIVSS